MFTERRKAAAAAALVLARAAPVAVGALDSTAHPVHNGARYTFIQKHKSPLIALFCMFGTFELFVVYNLM